MPHRSPGKPVQINKHIFSKRYLNHNVDLEKSKPIISFLIIEWSLFGKPGFPFTRRCIVPYLDKIDPIIVQTKIFRFRECIFAISQLFPLGKRSGHSFEQSWIPFIKGFSVVRLVEIVIVNLDSWKFVDFVSVFSLFRKYVPYEKHVAFYLNKLECPWSKDALCQVW